MSDHAREISLEWARLGAFGALNRLGIKFRKANREAFIACPWHNGSGGSCTVAIGQEGTLRVHCFGCSRTWDFHAFVGQLAGIDPRTSFPALLAHEAELLGRWDIVDELEGKVERRAVVRKPMSAPEPEPEREYPPSEEVEELIGACTMTQSDAEVSEWLRSRALDPVAVDLRGLAFALPADVALPRWASYQRKTWTEIGHRLIVPLYDATGKVRSVRAGRVVAGDSPKRLPPSGHKCSGLVMADAMAQSVLASGRWPADSPWRPHFMIAEGEPDWLSLATMLDLHRGPQCGMFGIFSGAWTPDIAARIPARSVVVVCTDPDPAGDKYATIVAESLAGRCDAMRGQVAA